jgi:hypothetical protein
MRRQSNRCRAVAVMRARLRYLAIIIVPVSKHNSLQLRLKMMELRHAASTPAATSHGTTRASSFLNKCLS